LESIDTATSSGQLALDALARLAKSERDLMRNQTSAGLAAARVRGCHGGRPSVLTAFGPCVGELRATRKTVDREVGVVGFEPTTSAV
jgi:DNA invertase Pin-like site-specific DNA recombinase